MAIEQQFEFNLFPEHRRGLSIFQNGEGGDKRQRYQAWSKGKMGLVTTAELSFGPEYASIHNATWGVFADNNQEIYLPFVREENFEAGVLLEFDKGIWKPEETTVSINGLVGTPDYTSTFTHEGVKIRDQRGHELMRIIADEEQPRFLVQNKVQRENYIICNPLELMGWMALLDKELETVRDWQEVSYEGLRKLRRVIFLLANKFLVNNDRIDDDQAREFLANFSLS